MVKRGVSWTPSFANITLYKVLSLTLYYYLTFINTFFLLAHDYLLPSNRMSVE